MSLAYLFDSNIQFQDRSGNNNVNGFLRVYIDNTDDRAVTYKDFNGTLNQADIRLDNNGRAVVIVDDSKTYRLEVYGTTGVLLWTLYPISPKATGINETLEALVAAVKSHTIAIEGLALGKKNKQQAKVISGTLTQTVKSFSQNADGEITVEFEDIAFPHKVLVDDEDSVPKHLEDAVMADELGKLRVYVGEHEDSTPEHPNKVLVIDDHLLREDIDINAQRIENLEETIADLDVDSVPHAYLGSSLFQSAGDSVTTGTPINVFSCTSPLVGDCFEFEQTTVIDDTPFGYVWIEPGTYLINASVTLQWVGDPRGTFIAKVGKVMGENFDFSQEQEIKRNTTKVVTIPNRMKLSVNITYDAGTPVMGFWIQSMQVVKLAGGMSQTNIVHDDTLVGQGSVADPLGITPAAFGKIKDIQTSIIQFRTGDVIPVDGPNGPAKMSKDDLLRETAENTVDNLGLSVSKVTTTADGNFINSSNLWQSADNAHMSIHSLPKGKYFAFRKEDTGVFAILDSTTALYDNMPDYSNGNFGRFVTAANEYFYFEITDDNGSNLVSFYFGVQNDDDLRIYKYDGDVSSPVSFVEGLQTSDGKLRRSNVSRTDIVKVNGGDTFRFTPNSGQSVIIGFLTSSKIDFSNVLPYSSKAPNRIIFGDVRDITAPSDARYMLVARIVSGVDVTPTYVKTEKTTKACTYPSFVNAGLVGPAVMFVTPGNTTDDHVVNVSKDIFVTDHQYVSYSVTPDYSVMFIKMNRDFTESGNSGWLTGSGTYLVTDRYFRLYVKKTAGGTIKPTDGYSVAIDGASIPYDDGQEIILNPNGWTGDGEFIAGSDARCAIQVLSDVAYMNSKKLLLRNGVFELNSYQVYGSYKVCIVFSQEISQRQYLNEFHDRVIEGWIKPCGYEGDGVTIVKMSDALYSSLTEEDIVSLFGTPQYSVDWSTYFMTCYFRLKNLVIKVPNNQKSVTAVNLAYSEGGSRLEHLRIVGIPTNLNMSIESDRPAMSSAPGSIGVASNTGSTWNTNSYWDDIEIHGFRIGARFVGMEHAFVHNLTVQWCTYGMKFKGGNQHPIVLVAVQDEHNINLPDFGSDGGAITLLGYNACYPESCPTGYTERSRAIGDPIGRIEFTNNIRRNGTISSSQDYPSLFEKGHGERCHVMNMHHRQIGTTAYRNSIDPNVGQRYYDTDTEKEYICVGIEPSVWKEL